MKYFIAVCLISIATIAGAADVTFQWDLYSDQPNIDGFNFYLCTASPCEALTVNRLGSSVVKNGTSLKFTGVSIGQKYGVMTAYKGTVESLKSNEGSAIVRPGAPTSVIISITQ